MGKIKVKLVNPSNRVPVDGKFLTGHDVYEVEENATIKACLAQNLLEKLGTVEEPAISVVESEGAAEKLPPPKNSK